MKLCVEHFAKLEPDEAKRMRPSLPPDSDPQPSTPEPGIRQQALNSPLGGMQAAIGDGNVQIQINLHSNESPNHQEEILFDSLIWLKETISQTDEWFWRERDIQDWLVSLLEQCWRCHQAKLRQKQASFDAFKDLLKKLAEFQNSMALEIQQRVASTQL